MDADIKFKGVATDFCQADLAAVGVSLGASVKDVWKLYLCSCHGVNYTSSAFWCQWGRVRVFVTLWCFVRRAYKRRRAGGLALPDIPVRGVVGLFPLWYNRGMKKIHSLAVLSAVSILSLSLSAAGGAEIPDLRIVGATDKHPLAYVTGDEVTFTISLSGVSALPGPMKFKWNIWGDGGFEKNGEEPAELGKPLVLKVKAEKPGSFRVYAGLFDAKGVQVRSPENGKVRKLQWFGGAVVDSAKLPRAPEPADFDKFWSAQKARLAAEPLKVTRRQVKPAPHDDVNDCWAIDIACPGGRDLHGYLTMPKTWKDGKKFTYAEVVTCALGLH
ncbi:MAG: hypothetical protein IKJ45_18455, partial [Kiritimatiellae bacterium]|nr:hypothetical protein [Kiritimatiellia bacterium]